MIRLDDTRLVFTVGLANIGGRSGRRHGGAG